MTQTNDLNQRIVSLMDAQDYVNEAPSQSSVDNFEQYQTQQQHRWDETERLAEKQKSWDENPVMRLSITVVITFGIGGVLYFILNNFLSVPSFKSSKTQINKINPEINQEQLPVPQNLVGAIKADQATGNLAQDIKEMEASVEQKKNFP